MPLVRIIKSWSWPDLSRQTPGKSNIWKGVHFTDEPAEKYDYVVVLNSPAKPVSVQCPVSNVWQILQEPPVPEYATLHRGIKAAQRIYTQDVSLTGPRYVQSHGALPWHVERTYDWLKSCPPDDKTRRLSWITSNYRFRKGHQERMNFLAAIRGEVEFDLWGKGFEPIADKWDGLAPYRYTLAIENYSGPFYWSEKIADAFLAWTMPIYYGCTNLADYFPPESFVQINIHNPDALQIIKETIASERWRRNRDAIAHARELVLDKFQIFPFIEEQIASVPQQVRTAEPTMEARVTIDVIPPPQLPFKQRLVRRWRALSKGKYNVRRSPTHL